METPSLTLHSFPKAIIHIDADAFFASCEQSLNPKLKGKPVITGQERGIAASMSYEAKKQGVTRGMTLSEIKRTCPDVIILPSDYETYSLLSKKFFNIVRRYTPDVEEYSIDECFADITGLRRPLHRSYPQIVDCIRNDLERELGVTFSLGLGPNKVVAKIASKWKKPFGLTVIPGNRIHLYLERLPVGDVWGIGTQTTAYLQKQGIRTALDLARKGEAWVKRKLTKPHYELWQELNGNMVYALETKEKQDYQSISKIKTFRPPSKDRAFIFAQLSRNIENACIKARRYHLAPKAVAILLRTQQFHHRGTEIMLSCPTAIPNDIINLVKVPFDQIYKEGLIYRATSIVLMKLEEDPIAQVDLFQDRVQIERQRRLFEGIDLIDKKFGKHTVYLGSSFLAHRSQRNDLSSKRRNNLFKGENLRKHVGLPLLIGEVR